MAKRQHDGEIVINGERTAKRKRAEQSAADTHITVSSAETAAPAARAGIDSTKEASDSTQKAKGQSKKARFIVFVGNLPYSTTTESIASHFAKIHPDSIRHITERQGQASHPKGRSKSANNQPKSKGFAFLEFNGFDRMKTCLKLYHHSDFNDGNSPARKINVELTAGGGGRGDARRDKLKTKNAKLEEERKQRVVARKTEKKDASTAEQNSTIAGEQDDIHPSRRGRIKSMK